MNQAVAEHCPWDRKQACVRLSMVDPEGSEKGSKANRSHVRKLQLDLGVQPS